MLLELYNLSQFNELKNVISATRVKTKDENVKIRKIASNKIAKTAKTAKKTKTSIKKTTKKFISNFFKTHKKRKFFSNRENRVQSEFRSNSFFESIYF